MLSDVQFCVQPLSVYTPRFIAVIVPFKGTAWDVVSAARVVTVRAIPTVTREIISILAHFCVAMGIFLNSIILNSEY